MGNYGKVGVRMKAQWLIISALLFAVVTAVFAVINVDSVQVNFLFAKTETPLILVILISALLGGLMVGLFGIIRQFRMQRQIRQLEKQAESVKSGVADTGKMEPTAAANTASKQEINEGDSGGLV
jgi:lipopolysaccharide assembly protein A